MYVYIFDLLINLRYFIVFQLIASAVAVTAMAGYAYTSGLVDVVRNIEIRIGEEGDGDGEYDEEEGDTGQEED